MEITINNINYKALKNISMCFFDACITGVIGKNGSGKTLISEIISTIRKPDTGNIIIDSQVIDLSSPFIDYIKIRSDVGIVMQNVESQLFQETVKDHINFQLSTYNYKNTEKRIIDSLSMVGLDESFINKKIKTLSNGERFLVALAGVLSYNPKVIILDDPTNFLDYKKKVLILKLLKRIKGKYKKTIIIFSNDIDFIYELSDYVYVLNNGKIVLHGDKSKVFTNKSLEKYNIELPDIVKLTQEFKSKSKCNIPIRDNISDLIKDIYFYIEKKRG